MVPVLTVAELTHSIKKLLEGRYPYVCVKGEISNLKEQSSGHLYFTLKDLEAQMSAVLFKGNARTLTRPLKNGDQVVVKGEISVYVPRGNYQFLVRELEYMGLGELLLKLHELKVKLEQKGWFAKERKRPLPKFPRTIGVVTSPTGAVIQDILNVLSRRFSGFRLILNPVKVQGEGSAQEIAQAIEQFNRYGLADVLIVGRGGGSLEDLWAFNEEIVAAAIVSSKIPVISAVGHETDFCIADYVADLRAPTPSAAAEMVIAEKQVHLTHLAQSRRRIQQMTLGLIRQHRVRLTGLQRQPLLSSPYAILGKYHQMRDELITELQHQMKAQLQRKQMHLLMLKKQLLALKPSVQIQLLKEKLTRLHQHLKALDPKNVLTKGYCILFRENTHSAILSSQEVHAEETVQILMHDGKLTANIKEIV